MDGVSDEGVAVSEPGLPGCSEQGHPKPLSHVISVQLNPRSVMSTDSSDPVSADEGGRLQATVMPLGRRNPEVLADLATQKITDFGMARDR